MSINERIYRIEDLLKNRNSISFNELQEKLEISRATLKRDIAYMRDRLGAPIIFDRELGGYRLEESDKGQHELLQGQPHSLWRGFFGSKGRTKGLPIPRLPIELGHYARERFVHLNGVLNGHEGLQVQALHSAIPEKIRLPKQVGDGHGVAVPSR